VRRPKLVESSAGTVITTLGQPGDSFFVIIDGTVAMRTPIGPGAELHPGDFLGEMSLLDGEPRSATIVATTDVRLLIVDRASVVTLEASWLTHALTGARVRLWAASTGGRWSVKDAPLDRRGLPSPR
jgi:cyclic nucleotide-binding protein